MKVLVEKQLEQAIYEEKVLVYFSSRWRDVGKRFEIVLEELDQIIFPNIHINLYKFELRLDQNIIEYYHLLKVPTLIYFIRGAERGRLVGGGTRGEVLALLGMCPDL